MSPMRIIVLIGSLIAAAAAAFLVQRIATPTTVTATVTEQQTITQVAEVEVSEVQVLVSRRDMKPGDLIREEDLEWAPWPEESLVEGFVTEELTPDAIEVTAGGIARTPIYIREPINTRKIVSKGEQGLMAALITQGMRAISVEISTESASGGFILPNDRVDLILTHDVEVTSEGKTTERPVSVSILTNARVLAIDQVYRTGEDGGASYVGNVATLEVTPKEAEMISLSQSLGSLSLSLRPYSESLDTLPRNPRTDLLDMGSSYDGGKKMTIYRNGKAYNVGGGR
ncbi:MAG: Flp pilus assembly protein CpaB [Hyphomonas sp.]